MKRAPQGNPNPSPETRFKTVKAEPWAKQPISVKYSVKVDEILRGLPNRSDRIRQWVIEGMRRDGLLDEV